MAYFMINNTDISGYVSALNITRTANYTSQLNAAGNTRVDYINSKRTFEIKIIPLTDAEMQSLLSLITFNATISYRNPNTNALETNVDCICDETAIEYYTIQQNKVMYREMTILFYEL